SRRRHTRSDRDWSSTCALPILQVLVDAQGFTRSRELLTSCGSARADDYALELAKTARFVSIETTGPDRRPGGQEPLTVGVLVFRSEERRVGKEWRSGRGAADEG